MFDLREFKKCAYVLKSYQNDSKFQSAIFLHTYSLFMGGEMKKEEEYYENGIINYYKLKIINYH